MRLFAIILLFFAAFAPPAVAQTTPVGPPIPPNLSQPLSGFEGENGALTDPSSINPLAIIARAAGSLPGGTSGVRSGSGGESGSPSGGLSTGINILVVLTVISLVPSIMLMTTCFVRIVIVLGLLKQAIGTQALPPPQVIVGLSMFITLLVMAPTIERINTEAIAPYNSGQIRDYDVLWAKAKQPMRDFMFDQIEATGNWSCVYMILNYRGFDTSDPSRLSTSDVDMTSLIPAYMLSELKTSFLIGFKISLPFLVIDIVISSLLISMGMVVLPPVLISLPFKLLLFVLVDGWQLVVGSLMQSFVTRPAGSSASAAAAAALEHAGAAIVHLATLQTTGFS